MVPKSPLIQAGENAALWRGATPQMGRASRATAVLVLFRAEGPDYEARLEEDGQVGAEDTGY